MPGAHIRASAPGVFQDQRSTDFFGLRPHARTVVTEMVRRGTADLAEEEAGLAPTTFTDRPRSKAYLLARLERTEATPRPFRSRSARPQERAGRRFPSRRSPDRTLGDGYESDTSDKTSAAAIRFLQAAAPAAIRPKLPSKLARADGISLGGPRRACDPRCSVKLISKEL